MRKKIISHVTPAPVQVSSAKCCKLLCFWSDSAKAVTPL